MQIQVSTDNHIRGRETLADHVREVVEHAVSHFSRQITRIEVHLGDENGGKSGADDKRCVIEAHVERRNPIAVSHHAATVNDAVGGAAGKLKRSIGHDIERARVRR